MIYFIQADIIGRIKIGFCAAKRWQKRLHSLQTGSPVQLRLLATCSGSRRMERKLHARFSDARVLGEWFEPIPRLVRLIARLQATDATQQRHFSAPKRWECASAWLQSKLSERPFWTSADLFEAASKDGISRDAIFEARRSLRIPKAKRITLPSGQAVWLWCLGLPPNP